MIILFSVLMLAVFGNLLKFALKATWAVAKFVFVIVLLPIGLIVLTALGFVYLALPILAFIGIFAILKHGSEKAAA